MKTTIDLPDTLLRRAKARAALRGRPLREYVIEAISEKLEAEQKGVPGDSGWRSVFGKAPKRAVREIQSIVEGEFEAIDPEQWR